MTKKTIIVRLPEELKKEFVKTIKSDSDVEGLPENRRQNFIMRKLLLEYICSKSGESKHAFLNRLSYHKSMSK